MTLGWVDVFSMVVSGVAIGLSVACLYLGRRR
jgi:hypothetical protein